MAMQEARRHGSERRGLDAQLRHTGGEPYRGAGSDGQFDARRVARALGWFSVALGAVEVLAPRRFSRVLGARGTPIAGTLAAFCGLRELAAGVGILTTRRPAGWMSSRVAGDVMDVALLMAALAVPGARRGRLLAATAGVIPVMMLDAKCAQQLSGAAGSRPGAARTRRRVTVDRPAEELYRFWRDFSNLPRFMRRIESVRASDENRSHWTARAPGGLPLEWDSEVTDDRPNERIGWRSVPGAPVETAGVVHFDPAPGGRGTQVTVEMEYVPPGRELTAQLHEDLRRFKRLMETGQIIVSDDRLTGAAQPPAGGPRAAMRSASRGVVSMLKGGGR
jgi:uncharacterized membrane protein